MRATCDICGACPLSRTFACVPCDHDECSSCYSARGGSGGGGGGGGGAPQAQKPKPRKLTLKRWPQGAKKPVIYLYPSRATDCEVTIALRAPDDARLTCVLPWPADFCGTVGPRLARWRVRAQPDGTLLPPRGAPAGTPAVSSLFWESSAGIASGAGAADGGWLAMRGSEGGDWLLRELPRQGLTVREATEMAQYWAPEMGRYEWVEARFLAQRELEAACPLTISPRPDVTTRVFLLFRPCACAGTGAGGGSPVAVAAPPAAAALAAARAREGKFFVVEWGGAEVNDE